MSCQASVAGMSVAQGLMRFSTTTTPEITMTLLGYTRNSTSSQSDALQRDALKAVGVEERNIFSDVISGGSIGSSRPGFAALLAYAREGDVVVCWRIDRLGRSMVDVVTQVERLLATGIGVRSLQDGIDPSTSSGKLQLHLLTAMASYERELIRERVNAGLQASRLRGVQLGRRPVEASAVAGQVRAATLMMADGSTAEEAARAVGWSRATLYRNIRRVNDAAGVSA